MSTYPYEPLPRPEKIPGESPEEYVARVFIYVLDECARAGVDPPEWVAAIKSLREASGETS